MSRYIFLIHRLLSRNDVLCSIAMTVLTDVNANILWQVRGSVEYGVLLFVAHALCGINYVEPPRGNTMYTYILQLSAQQPCSCLRHSRQGIIVYYVMNPSLYMQMYGKFGVLFFLNARELFAFNCYCYP